MIGYKPKWTHYREMTQPGIETWTYPRWAFGFSLDKSFLQVYAFGRTIEIRWIAL